MLEILLPEIHSKIQSQKDAWSLYKRIIELKIKLNEQISVFEGKGIDSLFLIYNALIQIDASHLKDLDEDEQIMPKETEYP
jgi:hypothetical protein